MVKMIFACVGRWFFLYPCKLKTICFSLLLRKIVTCRNYVARRTRGGRVRLFWAESSLFFILLTGEGRFWICWRLSFVRRSVRKRLRAARRPVKMSAARDALCLRGRRTPKTHCVPYSWENGRCVGRFEGRILCVIKKSGILRLENEVFYSFPFSS